MGRSAKPWHRAHDDWWYATIRGERKKLVKGEANKKAAEKRFHELMAAPPEEESLSISLIALSEAHAEAKEAEGVAAESMGNYKKYIGGFLAHAGRVTAADEVTTNHLEAWLKSKPGWGPSTRRLAITVVGGLFAWGAQKKLIKTNPFKGFKRPPARAREEAMSQETFDAIIDGVSTRGRCIKPLLRFMRETGCRPSEAMRIEAAWIDFGTGVAEFFGKTTRKTGKNRRIHLTDAALAICRSQAALYPEGPLFRNSDGNPWTRDTMCSRFKRLRQKLNLPKGTCPETIRHGWITDALVEGVPIATVSALAGHTDTTMVSKVYSKLHTRTDHLKAELARIRPPEKKAQ